MPLHDMRKELKELRKELKTHTPVSKMRKGDIAAEIEKLKHMRETTAPVASHPTAPPRKMAAKSVSIKESKAKEHPVAPHHKSEAAAPAPKKKSGMKAKLAKMLEEMSSSDEE